MPHFRKKPVVIEARQLDLTMGVVHREALARWCGGETADNFVEGPYIAIETLEGVMKATPGDWIIRGVSGEFYPCKPEIFEATYELVEIPDGR